MKIAVCLKQVPDTAELKLDPKTNTLIREGVEAVLNPLDEFPLEAALRLRDACGGSVTAFTMGPPQANQVLHKAVAMGADQTVLVSDRKFAGADTWATSLTLAKAIEAHGPFDLVLCGKQAIDGDTAQVGPGIATFLNIPQVTYVTRIAPAGERHLRVERMLEHGTAVVQIALPALLTVLKEANEPRLPTLSGRIRAFRDKPKVVDAATLKLSATETGLNGSPTRVVKIAVPRNQRQRVRFAGAPKESVAALLTALDERGLRPVRR